MKITFSLFSFIFLSTISISIFNIDSNEIKGRITLANCPNVINLGDSYNSDGTEIMQSDDPLAKPDRNVIISLHPLDFTPRLTLTKDAYISQKEQTFLPNVLPIVVGSKVHFLNEDEFFHNVQSYTHNSRFSIGRRAPGISYSIKIKKVGEIQLSCDIHSHMNAKILSFDTPYFCRINEDGTYAIKNLPDGKYRIEIFHPNCENISDQVELKDGKILELDFNLSIRP